MASKAGLVEFCQKVYSLDVRGVWAGAFSCTRGIKKCQERTVCRYAGVKRSVDLRRCR